MLFFLETISQISYIYTIYNLEHKQYDIMPALELPTLNMTSEEYHVSMVYKV